MTRITRATATTPGGIGNLGPGLDVLGCALAGARDEVTATWNDSPGVVVLNAGHADLSRSPSRHTSAIAAAAVLREAIRRGIATDEEGIALTARKGLPLSAGQGGSAASAVAGAAAANALLGDFLETTGIFECALQGEERVAGRHLDNIAPQHLGGIVLVRSIGPIEFVRLPVPTGLHVVIARPAQRLSTARARRALPASVPLTTAVHQLAQVSAMVAACYRDDLVLFGRSVDDRIAEPARANLIPGFRDAKRAALDAGALGASISGAGPSMFAVTGDAASGDIVASAVRAAYAQLDIECSALVTTVDTNGTMVNTQ